MPLTFTVNRIKLIASDNETVLLRLEMGTVIDVQMAKARNKPLHPVSLRTRALLERVVVVLAVCSCSAGLTTSLMTGRSR